MDATSPEVAGSTIVVGLADLLWATDTENLEVLAELADGDCDADVWVEETDDGIEIGAGVSAICLRYPFTVAEFWATVEEVDRDEVRRWEAMADEDAD
jgi:hypothetical protein